MWKWWAPVAAATILLGCYDSQSMVQRVRDDSVQTQLVEIDLGKFYVTLPRDAQTGSPCELSVHFFGSVPPYRANQVRGQLASGDYRLRHETLVALRITTHEELAETSLTTLKERLRKVANAILEEAPVEAIGFYEFRLVPR